MLKSAKGGVTTLVATLALFVVLASSAQATPHIFVNGVKAGSEPIPIIGWGTITLALTKPPADVGTTITCHNAIAGTGFNPEGGGAGKGKVNVFATFLCESEHNCLLGEETRVLSEKTPWPTVLTEEVAGVIRTETTGIQVDIECVASNGSITKETKFDIGKNEKGQRPRNHNGTSASHPSFVEFGAGSGELEVVGSSETVTGKTEGEVKEFGYEEQELLTSK